MFQAPGTANDLVIESLHPLNEFWDNKSDGRKMNSKVLDEDDLTCANYYQLLLMYSDSAPFQLIFVEIFLFLILFTVPSSCSSNDYHSLAKFKLMANIF